MSRTTYEKVPDGNKTSPEMCSELAKGGRKSGERNQPGCLNRREQIIGSLLVDRRKERLKGRARHKLNVLARSLTAASSLKAPRSP